MPTLPGAVFQCEQCARKFRLTPELAGKRVKCKCGATITVPLFDPDRQQADSLPRASGAEMVPPPLPPIIEPSLPAQAATPLNYARPGIDSKPGILIAIGIIAILVACVSVLASGWTAGIWWRAYTASVPPPPLPAPAPLGPAPFGPYTGSLLGPRGMPAAARAPIVAGTELTGAFAADRRALLDRILAEAGLDLLPTLGMQSLTPSAKQPDPKVAGSQIYFDLPNNKQLSLGITVAKCYQTAFGPVELHGDVVTRPGAGEDTNHWSALAVERRIGQLRTAMPGITAMQAQFIAIELQKHFSPMRYSTGPSPGYVEQIPISQGSLGPGGVLSIDLNNTGFWIMPDGRGIDKQREPLGLNPATGAPLTQPIVSFTPQLPGDSHLMLALFVYCVAVIVLGLFLAVAGVRTLVSPASGVPLLCWFILIKFIFAMTEIYLSVAFFDSVKVPRQYTHARFDVDKGMGGLAASVTAQMIYPIALLIVFAAAASAREYVAQHGGYVGLFPRGSFNAFVRRCGELISPAPVRILIGILAAIAVVLVGFHALAIFKYEGVATPTDHIAAVVMLILASVVFTRLALRRRIGGAR